MKQEMDAVNAHLAEVFDAGLAPDSDEAVAAVEAARQLIHRWHYDCSRQFHVNLTAMTSSDPQTVEQSTAFEVVERKSCAPL